jgi:hypothetical protein
MQSHPYLRVLRLEAILCNRALVLCQTSLRPFARRGREDISLFRAPFRYVFGTNGHCCGGHGIMKCLPYRVTD